MSKNLRNSILILIVLISTLMHVQHFTKELMSIHVWRQTQTQSTIINFYEEDMNIFNPRKNERGDTKGIFRMEFPLMQWTVACLYKVFGNHIIITRLFMFIIGLCSIMGIYLLLNALFHNTILSVMGAWAFNFSPCFYYYTINPLPDNLALSASIWGIALFFTWLNNQKTTYLVLSGLFLSIGALCKLPFIVYYIIPVMYFIKIIFNKGFSLKTILQMLSVITLILLPIIWYAEVIPHWQGNPVVKGMLNNEATLSQLIDYFQHNLLSTLPELLLNYGSLLFFLSGFYFLFRKKAYKDSRFILLISLSILVLLYYVFEANAIGKIHDYYLFPFYPLLFILVAYGAWHLYQSGIKFNRYLTLILLLILPITCYLRMHERWNPDSPGFNKDLLLYKTELRNAVPNNSLVVAGNDESRFIFFYYIDKKGWGFNNDELTADNLETMINKGAKYLYTDSRKIDASQQLAPYLDKLILKKGSINIYRLRE